MLRIVAATNLLAVFVLTACQTAPMGTLPGAPLGVASVDGRWASTDGIFYATFADGQFTSRFTQTNEVLANGRYRQLDGGRLQLDWFSAKTGAPATAFCNIAGPNRLVCNQVGASSFSLMRA